MIALGQSTVADIRRRLFDHVQKLPLRFFDRYPVGRLVTRLTNDLENLGEMFSMGIVALVADLFVMAFFAYVVFTIDARLALAAMSIVPVLAISAGIFRYKVREAFREDLGYVTTSTDAATCARIAEGYRALLRGKE